jgi:Flavodoxin
MSGEQNVKALVVYESFFGNTESIARAIASGLRLEGVAATDRDVKDVRDLDLDGYDLLVVGGPTHAFALSRPRTRDDAVARGGESEYASRGLREWLADIPIRRGSRFAAAFDTRVSKVRHLPMSGARSVAHLLRQRRFTLVARPTGFAVLDVEGPLEQSEMQRAVAWGRALGRAAQDRAAVNRERDGDSGRECSV